MLYSNIFEKVFENKILKEKVPFNIAADTAKNMSNKKTP